MEALGERIAEQRNKLGLTQKDLGEKLNVTAQAVSKWENGQSEPDIDTIKSMCALFGMTMDELVGNVAPSAEATVQPAAQPQAEQAAQAAVQPAPEPKIINGYCEMCKKPVGPDEYVVHRTRTGQHIYCHDCEKKREAVNASADYMEYKQANKRGFIWGGVAFAVMLGILLPSLLSDKDFSAGAAIAISIVLAVGAFTFIVQVFWTGAVISLFTFFVHSFKMPGVIFTLDWSGVVFLVVVKVLFAVLGAILSVIWFLIGVLVVCPVVSLIMFPFTLPMRLSEGKKLKAEADKTNAAAA